MGLITIDPHSLKEHTEIHKIPKFGVNRVSCQRASRAKTRGWRGGSIIELCESTEIISGVRKVTFLL